MKLEFIKANAGDYPLKDLCLALEIAPSAYHAWIGREPSARAQEDAVLQKQIRVGPTGCAGASRSHFRRRCNRMVALPEGDSFPGKSRPGRLAKSSDRRGILAVFLLLLVLLPVLASTTDR